ncbi:hypothetical protein [Streptomyces viridochromogenes]|nr:hypothetical protein [Streptomyces viridochromogenes]
MRRARRAGPAPRLRRVHQSASIAQIVGLDAGERIAGAGLDQARD